MPRLPRFDDEMTREQFFIELLERWESMQQIAERVFDRTGEGALVANNFRIAVKILKETMPLGLMTDMEFIEEQVESAHDNRQSDSRSGNSNAGVS
jgi:hypothetical protein